jgi:hypothetical protein
MSLSRRPHSFSSTYSWNGCFLVGLGTSHSAIIVLHFVLQSSVPVELHIATRDLLVASRSATAVIPAMVNIRFRHSIRRQIGPRMVGLERVRNCAGNVRPLSFHPTNLLLLDPQLPDWLPEIFVRNRHVGKVVVSIRFYKKETERAFRCARKARPIACLMSA